jgi:diacylglycerol kinase (ATP)
LATIIYQRSVHNMSIHTVFIANPTSGRGAGLIAADGLKQLAENARLDYKLVLTTGVGHAIQLAQDYAAQGVNTIVAVGGDGTANEVLNGLMRARQAGLSCPAMGVIGVGRGNDFAYGVGIPAGLEVGFQTLINGKREPMDVGLVSGGLYPEGRFFGNGVGIGFDAVVGFEALKLKRLHGFANYMVAALKTMFLYYRAPLVRIELDSEIVKLPALMVSIMNGRRMGGGFMMAPQSRIDDGLFDLCIVGQVSRMGILGLIPQFTKGTQAGHPKVSMRQSRLVKVTAEQGSLPAHADGETLCTEGETLSLELLPGALDIIHPALDTE